MELKDRKKKFLLLQINDALFPIGAYSHSYGLETYIQKDLLPDAGDCWNFLRKRMEEGFCYNEFLSARYAYAYGAKGEADKILELEEILEACRTPREVREAGRKLGSRFIKTVRGMKIDYENKTFEQCIRTKSVWTHSVIYGVFCASAGIAYEEAMEHYLYAQASSMVTNCVKTIPLSQTQGQHLLYQSQELLDRILRKLETLTLEDLCRSTPGFDIRSMQHEGLYSRIYMS